MTLRRLWLTDFRNYATAEVCPAPAGLTVVEGGNGDGKTNLLEAIGYLATLASFRGAPSEALVRRGRPSAVVRAETDQRGRAVLVEAEIRPGQRDRVLVNRQRLPRSRDLLGVFRVSVFAPDDLVMVQGGPSERRRYLDDGLVALHPRHDALRTEVDRVLRQRAALLKQCGGQLDAAASTTLDVWDDKLARAGEALVAARQALVADLEPVVTKAYDQVAATAAAVTLAYHQSWQGPLAAALAATRRDDVRRGTTGVGPHRDDLALHIDGLPARTHASRGEQRSLALALRLAVHQVVTAVADAAPVLLLDDVFSELDAQRSEALLAHLPSGQALLTTAGPLPPTAHPDARIRVRQGVVR
ncbi:MAG TPA: DNA replication/repair protein RecF [Acidimicrobiales bacterium]|nr:DNA replication/repair protein RecF [Acidimicrobiales bacterium]